MRFLGPVTQLGADARAPARPRAHDRRPRRRRRARPGRPASLRVGFEVRVEVATDDQVVLVTKTRPELGALGIEVGSSVHLRPITGAPTVRVATAPKPEPEPESEPTVVG